MAGGRWLDALVPGCALAAGLAIAFSAFQATGKPPLPQQQAYGRFVAQDVERTLRAKLTPAPGDRRTPRIRCRRTEGPGAPRLWRCDVSSRSERRTRLRVTIAADGSFRTVGSVGRQAVRGCCVRPGGSR